MDVRPLDWREYLQTYCIGVKEFVLKEDPSATRKNLIRYLNCNDCKLQTDQLECVTC